MQNIKLSVVAGIYFPPEICFRRFLDSCLKQKMDNVEFVFLLDSPEDSKTREILEEYKQQFDNNKNTFKIIENEKNLGVVETYQKGCKLSSSDTILIMDSDDFFDDDLILQMYRYFVSKELDFLAPRILIGYIGELDVFYALNNNDDPDDTCIMFKKGLLDKFTAFTKNINHMPMKTIFCSGYKADILPLRCGTFYYYTVTKQSATSGFILQQNNIPEPKGHEIYRQIVIKSIETQLGAAIGQKISFDDYTIDELKNMAKRVLDLDNFSENDFTYNELNGI